MTELLLSILLTANVVCTESSRNYSDGEVVAQVAVNRATAADVPLWRVYGDEWNKGMRLRCRWPLTVEHYSIGLRARLGLLDAPAWASDAVAFVTPRRLRGRTKHGENVAAAWRRRGLERAGVFLHVFYRRREAVEGCGRR